MKSQNNDNTFPLVSVVVLNYNGLHFLKKTIPAIIGIDYPNKEVIVVDNGSSDDSVCYLRNYVDVKVVENCDNLGYSVGKNVGVNVSQGKYVLMLDNDILIKSTDILNKLIACFNFSKSVGLVQVPLLDLGCSNTKHYGLYYSSYGVNAHQPAVPIDDILSKQEELLRIGSPTGACMFFEREIWNKVGGFDNVQKFNIDDVDIGPRFSLLGYDSFLYTKDYFLHLGVNNAVANGVYAYRFKTVFSGHARSMLKNYQLKNLVVRLPLLFLFQSLKAFKYSIKRRQPGILMAFLSSIGLFIKNLRQTLNLRSEIQKSRTTSKDEYLFVRPIIF